MEWVGDVLSLSGASVVGQSAVASCRHSAFVGLMPVVVFNVVVLQS